MTSRHGVSAREASVHIGAWLMVASAAPVGRMMTGWIRFLIFWRSRLTGFEGIDWSVGQIPCCVCLIPGEGAFLILLWLFTFFVRFFLLNIVFA